MPKKKELINWCGYNWSFAMEHGRPLHPANSFYYFSKDEVNELSDGTLEFSIHYNPKKIKWWNKDWTKQIYYNSDYSCGLIRSEEIFSYGEFEAEVRLPAGNDLWPAFWLTADDSWPSEIDIFEGYSDSNGKYVIWDKSKWWFPKRITKVQTCVHYKDNGENKHIPVEGIKCKCNRKLVNKFNKFKCIIIK